MKISNNAAEVIVRYSRGDIHRADAVRMLRQEPTYETLIAILDAADRLLVIDGAKPPVR